MPTLMVGSRCGFAIGVRVSGTGVALLQGYVYKLNVLEDVLYEASPTDSLHSRSVMSSLRARAG